MKTLIPFLCCALFASFGAHAETRPLEPVTPPRPAPDFVLQQLVGGELDSASLRGRTVVVNFWATWCPPCVKEMPGLQRAWEQVRDEDIVVVGVAVGEEREKVADFVAGAGLDFPIVLDPDTSATMAWAARGLPTSYVVDRAGNIVLMAEGEREWDDPAVLDQIRGVNH